VDRNANRLMVKVKRPLYVFGVLASGLSVALAVTQPSGTAAPDPAFPDAVAAQPIPGVLRGSGSRVLAVRIPSSRPLVITGRHLGQANFIVHLVGVGDSAYVFNEIGSFAGQALVDDVHPGRHRVAIEADGSWTLAFSQPTPSRSAVRLPARFTGHGSRVIAVRAASRMQPVLTATHRGKSNFIVHLVGITNGVAEYPFNEIGNDHGQQLIEDLPAGYYLLAIQADGTWTIKITR
jgi:hypothetical protein